MSVIELAKDDQTVMRAMSLETSNLTEVGFIPGDEYGCKIYARNVYGLVNMIAIHSKSYGCSKKLDSDTVVIKNSPKEKTSQLTLTFE